MRALPRLLLLATLTLAACTSWHARTAPASGSGATFDHPIRVTRTDRSVVLFDRAQVVGDSLVGDVGTARTAIALTDVARVEERRVSALRTGGLALGVLLVATTAFVVAIIAVLVQAK